MSIIQLSNEVINKIAAGEVVERPSSVVKELIENSIDAGATMIEIDIVNGGQDLIKVKDNGSGMSESDAMLSLQRHTTSKIIKIDDLFEIKSMGFRGEALASISSVSDFTLETSDNETGEGVIVRIINNDIVSQTASVPKGTIITVKDLFHNVPARRKFLKTISTEFNNILDLVIHLSLQYTEISWKLTHNNKEVLFAPKVAKQIDRIAQVLGKDVSHNLLELNVSGEISVKGYIGNSNTLRATKKLQYFFVNGRPISDYMISKAVSDVYKSLNSQNGYPAAIVNIIINPKEVDINVHPRKMEVKFLKSNEIFKIIKSAVKSLLVQNNILTSVDLIHSFANKNSNYETVDEDNLVFRPKKLDSNSTDVSKNIISNASLQFTGVAKSAEVNNTNLLKNDEWKLIGQIHKSYLLVETRDGFLVIDQHASAERLNYERILKNKNSEHKFSQRLLSPQIITLSLREVGVIKEYIEIFNEIGFEIEEFGGNTIIVKAVPSSLSNTNIIELVKGVIDDIDNDSELAGTTHKAERLIKYSACRGAIMFNDKLTVPEQIQLINDIHSLPKDKLTCCHGRPFMKEFLKSDLEKLFDRH